MLKVLKKKTKVISSHAKRDSKIALEKTKKGLLQLKEMRKKRGQEEIIVEEELETLDFVLKETDINTSQIEGPTLVKKI